MRIILDMDDVIVKFNEPAHARLGIPHEPWPWEVGVFNIECYDDKFWSELDSDWWRHREWMSFGKELFNLACAMSDNQVRLASTLAPYSHGRDVDGKLDWIHAEVPQMGKSTCFCTGNKDALAAPDVVLIDDHDKTIDAFRRAGGAGILVPRPHNFLFKSSGKVVDHVRRGLLTLIKRGL